MRALLSTAKRAAATDAPVLISGESGTGKELLARFVHDASPRSSGPFAPFNCSAVPRDIVDSHLFGHRRGSFTGAVDTSVGVIPGAAGGTVFLDELSELPLEVQPKLLRFLDSGEIHALGEARPKVVNVRVVAACNVEPEELVAHGRLRKDLYYRLNVFRLRVPPLRDRRDDVLALIDWFLADTQRRAGRSDVHLAPATRAHLALYEWPGNVRELAAEMYRLVACAENGETIAPAALSREVLLRSDRFQTPRQTATGFLPAVNFSLPLKELLEEVEKAAVEHALAASGGSQTDAAERLGLSRKGLYLKRQRLGI
jgi:transcriptional regulator with PAS, ATPase and Fis domain